MANFKPARIERQEARPLSDLLRLFVAQNGLGPSLYRRAVFELWDEVAGCPRLTVNKFLRNKTLYITVSSSLVRSQLHARSGVILQRMNDMLETNDIVAMSGIRDKIEKIVLH